jgi:23S rRNA-/tRNA-specific pseudouridylate synthase
MCLHAWKLSIVHPFNGERLHFIAPPPEWAS